MTKAKSKTVWINGTERLLPEKNRYGVYMIPIDDKDVRWLNKQHKVLSTQAREIFKELIWDEKVQAYLMPSLTFKKLKRKWVK